MALPVHDQRVDARARHRRRPNSGRSRPCRSRDRPRPRTPHSRSETPGRASRCRSTTAISPSAPSRAPSLRQFEKIEAAVVRRRRKPAVGEIRPRSAPLSSRRAATAFPLAINSGAALANKVAEWRIERPECEPPPRLTTSVSPMMMSMLSTGTASSAPTTCAKLVSWPCPLGPVPITTSTRPLWRHRDLAALARRPDRGFDIVRQAQPEQPAARLALAARRAGNPSHSAIRIARSMLAS